MKSSYTATRSGFTLLELMITTTMLALLTTASMTLVRTSYAAWNCHITEQQSRQAGIAVLRHIVRESRQATSVSSISAPSDLSGSVSLMNAAGETLVWRHDPVNKAVLFGKTVPTELLASGIEEMSFVGLRANGIESTLDVGQIHSLHVSTKVKLNKGAATNAIVTSCRAWLRAW